MIRMRLSPIQAQFHSGNVSAIWRRIRDLHATTGDFHPKINIGMIFSNLPRAGFSQQEGNLTSRIVIDSQRCISSITKSKSQVRTRM